MNFKSADILPLPEDKIEETILSYKKCLETKEDSDITLKLIEAVSSIKECCLAFSGGTDSCLILNALLQNKCVSHLFVITTKNKNRDAYFALQNAEQSGLHCDKIIISEDDILESIETHKSLLNKLSDYTQRILAVCEIQLAKYAAAYNLTLITGHGPESILGGFRRRKQPMAEDFDTISKTMLLNISRLNAIAAHFQIKLLLPFLNPALFSSLLNLSKAGKNKNYLSELLVNKISLPQTKFSLQNGSGIHYTFEKLAKKNGFKRNRYYMEKLLE